MKRALIDLSNVIWTALMAGKDKENGERLLKWGDVYLPHRSAEAEAYTKEHGEGKEVIINSAQYGFETAVDTILRAINDIGVQPRDCILVQEGMNSKADRTALLGTYKSGRDKLPQQYVEFQKCRDAVVKAFMDIGANLCWQDGGVEADDVLGYLAQHLKGERYVVSGDHDMAVLVDPDNGVHHWRNGVLDKNPFGDFPHRQIPTYISLVGDSGDGIPGAKGFGESAWLELMTIFGEEGIEVMGDLIKTRGLGRLTEDLATMPKLQKILDSEEQVYVCYQLGRLRTERVNTVKRPLMWKAGMVKPRTAETDSRLAKYAAQVVLVTQENYASIASWARTRIEASPYVGLDIETTTPEESDAWLEGLGKDEDRTPVDVFGSTLTGLSLAFGPNLQYVVYLMHDHVEEAKLTNITIGQVRDFVGMVPRQKIIYVHNAAFELPVCFMEWGEDWKADPEYHGFLPNVRDTLIGASYMDENKSKGLKAQSLDLLGYTQTTYDEVTTKVMTKLDALTFPQVGKLRREWDEEPIEHENGAVEPGVSMVQIQFKMNQITGTEVLAYGADDAICTVALANIQRIIMEIEGTWDIYEEVETFPAYVTALAFVQGVDFSLETMREMEKEDDETHDKAWVVLRDYLIKIGFDGTRCPVIADSEPASIKLAHEIITGRELKTMVRKADKLAKLIVQQAEGLAYEDKAFLISKAIETSDLAMLNHLCQSHFLGEPTLDLNSPKQMAALLYDRMRLPVNITNKATDIEHKHNPALADALRQHNAWRRGKIDRLSEDEWKLVRKKAKANDDAIDYALAFDQDHIDAEARAALKAIGAIKKVLTRRQLFYRNYWKLPHWKDGKIHASANQCAAVTRRYSMNNPNLQQLPKKGDGARFRAGFLPHHKDAVVCSIDYTGQELRLAAEVSQDKNMLACYIGDKLKDIHSITAAGAMKLKWGDGEVKRLFTEYAPDLVTQPEGEYDLFIKVHKLFKVDINHVDGKRADDLRKDSKNVNFGAQNGAQDLKLSETLIMRPSDAALFLSAREEMFPDVGEAAKEAERECKRDGYVMTLMGARRHLREAIASDDNSVASRAARQGWNFKIQGSAGEMTKLGIGRLWKSGALHRFDVRFVAPIHDELVTSVNKDHAVEFIKIKSACMTGPYANMKVPILASVSIGPNFKDQIECGDEFDAVRIKKALNKIFHREEVAA